MELKAETDLGIRNQRKMTINIKSILSPNQSDIHKKKSWLNPNSQIYIITMPSSVTKIVKKKTQNQDTPFSSSTNNQIAGFQKPLTS